MHVSPCKLGMCPAPSFYFAGVSIVQLVLALCLSSWRQRFATALLLFFFAEIVPLFIRIIRYVCAACATKSPPISKQMASLKVHIHTIFHPSLLVFKVVQSSCEACDHRVVSPTALENASIRMYVCIWYHVKGFCADARILLTMKAISQV